MSWIFHTYKNQKGEQALQYKFSYRGDSIKISSGVSCHKDDFDGKRIKGSKEKSNKLVKIEGIVLDVVDEATKTLPYWSKFAVKNTIEARISGRKIMDGKERVRLKEAWTNYNDYLDSAHRFKDKKHSIHSMGAVLALTGNMYVDEISPEYLKKLKEALLVVKKKFPTKKNPNKRIERPETFISPATVAGWLRDLRRVVIRVVGEKNSPFPGLGMPKAAKKKKVAMDYQELKSWQYVPVYTQREELVRDITMLRYLWLGMRITDQLLLKPENVQGGKMHYSTSKGEKPFVFDLTEYEQEIIDKWMGAKYVFPILNPSKTGEALTNEIDNAISWINMIMKRLAKRAGIEKNLSSHSARHTFAFINRDKGTRFIQDSFDHSDPKTTDIYLEDFETQDNLKSQVKI